LQMDSASISGFLQQLYSIELCAFMTIRSNAESH
jgi:hypothetical protein